VAKPNLVHQGYQLVRHIVPAVVKPARTLWHEVIGFLFLALAAIPIPSGLFVTIMAGYGISSFRRARKISRS
jgi:nitrate reductase NapE component